MNTPKAILIGFALVAAAVYFSRDVGPAKAAEDKPRYEVLSAGNVSDGVVGIWVFNHQHGTVSLCVGEEEVRGKDETKSNCSLWSKAGHL